MSITKFAKKGNGSEHPNEIQMPRRAKRRNLQEGCILNPNRNVRSFWWALNQMPREIIALFKHINSKNESVEGGRRKKLLFIVSFYRLDGQRV